MSKNSVGRAELNARLPAMITFFEGSGVIYSTNLLGYIGITDANPPADFTPNIVSSPKTA